MAESLPSTFKGKVIVYGGKGALGNACVTYFKSKYWWVCSIDMVPNENADVNVIINPKDSWSEQESAVLFGVKNALGGQKVNTVICVAGGWAGGNALSEDLVKNSDLMWKQSVWTSVITASLAAKYLKQGGLVTLTGAKAALDGGTPGMIGYGLSKAAVHHLVKSLSEENSGLPDDSKVIGILPVTLDTPMNRKFMPKADFSSWTPLQYVAELLHDWSIQPCKFVNGSLVQLITEKGHTNLISE